MRILVTNDDGIYSPGIRALAQVASRFGEVRVVAPDVEMSAASHSITASRPLNFKRTPLDGLDAHRVNGTPADCVALGASTWDNKIDLVLSGINIGHNIGNAIWHSGTLAGAKHGALLGARGIAFSAPATDEEQPQFELMKPWVETVLKLLLDVPDLCLVNVNFPTTSPRGVLWTRQSVRHYDARVVPGKDPMGRTHYWYTVVPMQHTEEETDRWAVDQGFVSMTPLRLDLTDEIELKKAREKHQLDRVAFG